MTTVVSFVLCVTGTIVVGLLVNMLMCILSMIELNRKKEEVWNGETWLLDGMPFEEYFKQIDIWYELPRWLDELTEKGCGAELKEQ